MPDPSLLPPSPPPPLDIKKVFDDVSNTLTLGSADFIDAPSVAAALLLASSMETPLLGPGPPVRPRAFD